MTEAVIEVEAPAHVAPVAQERRQPVAVIGFISSTAPIAGADRIHLATADCADAGLWTGVVSKDMVAGDMVLVLLQDALLPPNDPRWAFMAARHFRVRMARFKGVPSECVIVPARAEEAIYPIGYDAEDLNGITKYEKALPKELAGVAKGNFPSFIPKTDEPNFQRVRDLERLMAGDWYATEKADGTSCTVYGQDDALHVCSRNLELVDGDNLYWRMARKYRLDFLIEAQDSCLAFQFEIVGPGVQGNPMGLEDNEIRVFTIYDWETKERVSLESLLEICDAAELPMARIVAFGSGPRTPDELRQLAEITYANGKPGEGIVIRGAEQNAKLSVKALNLNYKD